MTADPRTLDRSPTDAADRSMEEAFGPLSLVMLNDSRLNHAWRVNFLANFFTGPVYRRMDAQFGVSRPEFVILYCLRHSPGLVARDICLVTGLPKNSISRAVSDLIARRLIERGEDAADKRAKPLALTPDGSALLERLLPIMDERQSQMRRALTVEERREFDRLLLKMVYAMPDWVEPE